MIYNACESYLCCVNGVYLERVTRTTAARLESIFKYAKSMKSYQ